MRLAYLAAERLAKQYAEHGNIIIGFDFDDTVHPTSFPDEMLEPIREILRICKAKGFTLCLSTANPNIDAILHFCENNNIVPDFVNNSPVKTGGAKPYFNIFLDDKAGLQEAYYTLYQFLDDHGLLE